MPIALHHLIDGEIQHATRRDRGGERGQRRVMPAVFAHARHADLAKPHLDFIRDDRREDQIFAAEAFSSRTARAAPAMMSDGWHGSAFQ